MAAVLPIRPNTNSSGSGTNHSVTRKHSLSSVQSSNHSNPQISTAYDTRIQSPPFRRKHTLSITSQQSSAPSPQSVQSTSARGPEQQRAPYGASGARPQKHIRSQYPTYGGERHVEYILVASFDIDRGSVMEHQYPGPVGGDEHMLAELMLPDQTHMRSQDWTIFFLHKDAAAKEELLRERRRQRRHQRRVDRGEIDEMFIEEVDVDHQLDTNDDTDDESVISSDEDEWATDGPPLVYVLNLVNTKQDNTVKRGAVVKAMAICTRHSFLHIYKPLLLLALEQYFANPVLDTLVSLYNAVNSMDLSLMPRLNSFERLILQSMETKDLFVEKFESIISQQMASRDGSSTAAAATNTHGPAGGRGRFGLPRDTHEFETIIHYANVPVPVKVPTALSPETVGDFSLIKLITTFSTPHSTSPVAFNPTHPHLTTAGSTTHPIIVLINALLTQKRIIFIGHNLPSSEVAEAVLAACALASGGLLRGFTRHAFPYTDLTKIDDLLKVPGFIAGVTNPAFAHKNEWWDLLCDLPTGRMRISTRIEPAVHTEGVAFFQQTANNPSSAISGTGGGGISAIASAGVSLSAGLGGSAASINGPAGDLTGDSAFMGAVLTAIHERHGENAIRSKFRRWITKFTRIAAAFEETVYGASALQIHSASRTPVESPGVAATSGPLTPNLVEPEGPAESIGHGYVWPSPALKAAELAANATRIEAWRNTRSYYNYIQDLAVHFAHRPIRDLDLHHLHDKLAKLRLGHEQSANIYLAICNAVTSDAELLQLLATVAVGVWPSGPVGPHAGANFQQQQGLFHLALGLFHPREDVRESIVDLLGRIRENEAGRHFWASTPRFARMAFERVKQTRNTKLQDESF